jgi:hypothetical protein
LHRIPNDFARDASAVFRALTKTLDQRRCSHCSAGECRKHCHESWIEIIEGSRLERIGCERSDNFAEWLILHGIKRGLTIAFKDSGD